MQVRTQQRARRAPVSPDVKPGSTGAARDRRTVSVAITAATACAAVVILAVTFSLRGTPAVRTTRPGAAPADTSVPETVGSVQLRRALGWVDGLAVGLISTSDVSSRLGAQDPQIATAVLAAWSDLNSSGSSVQLRRALGWVDGLAAGLISTSDVSSRLGAQDPQIATAVLAAWSDLKAVAASD